MQTLIRGLKKEPLIRIYIFYIVVIILCLAYTRLISISVIDVLCFKVKHFLWVRLSSWCYGRHTKKIIGNVHVDIDQHTYTNVYSKAPKAWVHTVRVPAYLNSIRTSGDSDLYKNITTSSFKFDCIMCRFLSFAAFNRIVISLPTGQSHNTRDEPTGILVHLFCP